MSHWQNAIERVHSFVSQNCLIRNGDRLLLGVSGGGDSVFLAEVMAELQETYDLSIRLAHVNYGLRAEAADADDAFVTQYAQDKAWPLDTLRLTLETCQGEETNVQAWARTERYAFFRRLLEQGRADKVVLAHHMTDQVETVLLRMLRGSGLTGLTAMKSVTEWKGMIMVRPLLCLTREDIDTVLAERTIAYCHDESNESTKYRRNRLRHDVLPLLRKEEPSFERGMSEAIQLLQADEAYLQDVTEELLDRLQEGRENPSRALSLSRSAFQDLPLSLRLRLLRCAIVRLTGDLQSITFHHVRKIEELACRGPSQASYHLPGSVVYEQGPLAMTFRQEGVAL